jgi:hypothetical protein
MERRDEPTTKTRAASRQPVTNDGRIIRPVKFTCSYPWTGRAFNAINLWDHEVERWIPASRSDSPLNTGESARFEPTVLYEDAQTALHTLTPSDPPL